MGEIFIWRKSMSDTGKCPKCGTQISKNGYPTKNCMVADDPNDKRLWCGKCWKKGIAFQVGRYSESEIDLMQDDEERIKFLESQNDILNRKIKRLEDVIAFNSDSDKMIKKNHIEVLAAKDKMIQDLQKEIKRLEHRIDELIEKRCKDER